jgi:hypothetical protein
MNKPLIALGSILTGVVLLAGSVIAAPKTPAPTSSSSLQVIPFAFLDNGAQCDVRSYWINSTGNPAPGLFLMKGCPTATVAAAGADIIAPSVEGQSVSSLQELNFDYQNGGHCGAGAPRYNVVVDGNTYFLGCTQGTQTPTGSGWTHVVFGPTQFAAAGIPATGTINDIYLIFDEGTDTPTGGTIGTAGSVVLDNFSVNGQVVGGPVFPMSKDDCKNNGFQNFGDKFKNQGQCVSFFNHMNKASSAPSSSPSPSPSSPAI